MVIIMAGLAFCRKYAAAPGKKIHWPGGREEPPPDIPPCGFLGNSPDCDGKGRQQRSSHIIHLIIPLCCMKVLFGF